MADQYEFKLFNPNPDDITGWVPVIWAQKKNVTIRFISPTTWVGKGLKVFRVYPVDEVYFDGADTTAEQVKIDIIANPALFADWDTNDNRYSGDPNTVPTFTWSIDSHDRNELTIKDKHNGGKKPDGSGKSVDPVYDFILLFQKPDGKSGYDDILVDPRIRNEY